MKILYIESKLRNNNIVLENEEIAKLPKKIFLAYSVQYSSLAEQIKKQLERNKIKIEKFQQVLGCTKIKTKSPVLFIGSGKFHILNLFLQSPAIYIIAGSKIEKIPESEIQKLKVKKQTALAKFLKAEKLGILVSTKPGQENMRKAIEIKNKLKKKGKDAYIFISNNIDISQFENFNIDSWINTACPGLSYDSPKIINYIELKLIDVSYII